MEELYSELKSVWSTFSDEARDNWAMMLGGLNGKSEVMALMDKQEIDRGQELKTRKKEYNMKLNSVEITNKKGEAISFYVNGTVGYDLNDHSMFINDAKVNFSNDISQLNMSLLKDDGLGKYNGLIIN